MSLVSHLKFPPARVRARDNRQNPTPAKEFAMDARQDQIITSTMIRIAEAAERIASAVERIESSIDFEINGP